MKCRDLIDRALEVGRKLQSDQTGFVHLNDPRVPEGPHETIPITENLLFILALFRSRSAENIQEGKALLDHLLHFAVDGHLPYYLHEYPSCRDKYGVATHLTVLYLIATQFHTVLGEPLRNRLKSFVVEAATKAASLNGGPADLICLLGAVVGRIGQWQDLPELASQGWGLFEKNQGEHPLYWHAPDRLHHYITAWQVSGKKWTELEEHLEHMARWARCLCWRTRA